MNEAKDAEIVIGIVAPIGTPVEGVIKDFVDSLRKYGYRHDTIRLSQLLEDTVVGGPEMLPLGDPGYYKERMNAGDTLRKKLQSADALAAYAVTKINSLRSDRQATTDQRHAWILRTLKHPDEVRLLRAVYGRRFLLLGISASHIDRESELTRSGVPSNGLVDLIERDEFDEDDPYGQQVRKTFNLSDAFIEVTAGKAQSSSVSRMVGLIFGEPFITPTSAEQSMYHAQAAALRSAAFGRQVGAVLATQRGSVISTGANEVPRPGGGEYWDGDSPDFRDHVYKFDYNRRRTLEITTDVLTQLRDQGWLAKEFASKDPGELAELAAKPDSSGKSILSESRIHDLIEFGRIAHAEMSAIADAARRGIATQNSILYTTTYPCHMCARIIINAGIERVVYIDPYAKSLVSDMYSDLITDQRDCGGDKISFNRFQGVAPRLYATVFESVNRGVEVDGQHRPFDCETAHVRLAGPGSGAGADLRELTVISALEDAVLRLKTGPDIDANG